MYSSPTAVSSRRRRFMRTAVSLRWQRSVGRGCTAVQAVFGAESSSVRLLVQIPGAAAKMSRAAFTRAMGTMPSFRSLMYAYVQAFLEQVLVSVACNGAHSLKQRLARWLLMMRDRSD